MYVHDFSPRLEATTGGRWEAEVVRGSRPHSMPVMAQKTVKCSSALLLTVLTTRARDTDARSRCARAKRTLFVAALFPSHLLTNLFPTVLKPPPIHPTYEVQSVNSTPDRV